MPGSPRLTLASIRRARLFPIVVFYGSGAFVVLQVCDIFVSQLGLPGWVFPSAVVLLLAGFPVVVATALVYGARRTEGSGPSGQPGGRAGDADDGASEPAPVGGGGGEVEGGTPRGYALRLPGPLARLTWSGTLIAGVVAFTLLLLLVGGYAGSRATGIGPFGTLLAAGVLEDQEVLVLGDFEVRGTAPDMGRTVTEAMRVDLGQSGSISLLEGDRVREALARMGRSPDEPLDAELALELAIREGVKAVVVGEVASAGAGYQLVARVVAAEDGATLVAVRETAASDAAVIEAIDRLSHRLRERIGEPLRSLAARPPLTRTTTSSLEALQLYARALPLYREDPARALPLLQEAVELDPAFVAAWFHLGMALEQTGAPTSMIRGALVRGAEHLDRLTGMERYLFRGAYQGMVEGDYEGQLRSYETMVNVYPDNSTARLNLAATLNQAGDPVRAAALVESLVVGPSPSLLALVNMSRALIRQGRPDSAVAVLDKYAAELEDHPVVLRVRLSAEGAARDYEAVERTARRLLEHGASAGIRIVALGGLATVAAQRGREHELADVMERVNTAARELEMLAPRAQPGWLLFWRAGNLAIREGNPDGLRLWLSELATDEPADSASALDRPFLQLATAHAMAGDSDRARYYLDQARRWWPDGLVAAERAEVLQAEGLIALEEGRLDEAEALLLDDRFTTCPRCLLPLAARAREAAGEPERALELWDLYDRSKFINSVFYDAFWIPELYEARARLKEQLGDRSGAARELRLALATMIDPDTVHASRVAAWRRDLRRLE
jgi:tetratricopeptide (TPR) repeat protein